jgi:hypothetical protein
MLTPLMCAVACLIALPGVAQAIGKKHLVPTCIRDAQKNFKLINNPKYVLELQEIADDFGDTDTVTFIECDAVEGLFSHKNVDDDTIPFDDYIVYSPSFLNLATQGERAKLLFLLGHEYGHLSEGHFTDKKGRPPEENELEADIKGACAVAAQDASKNALIQILSAIRDAPHSQGYPPLEVALAAAEESYNNCLRIVPASNETTALPNSRVALVEPVGATIEGVKRSVHSLSTSLIDSPLLNFRDLTFKIPQWSSTSILAFEQVWETDKSLLLVLDDATARIDPPTLPGPSFSGLFFVGPFAKGKDRVVFNFGDAGSFTKEVSDPAGENASLTGNILAVALTFAALKYVMDTEQSTETIRLFAQLMSNALEDLRGYSGKVANFDVWATDLEKVDMLLERSRSNS